MKDLSWVCDIRAPSGYGRAARADLRAAIEVGLGVRVLEHRHDENQVEMDDPFWSKHYKKLMAPRQDSPEIIVCQETPEFYRPDPTCSNIARLEWETSKIIDYNILGQPSYNWVAQINRMTEVWAASQFVADVLKDSGVEIPCHVIPHPTDLGKYCPGEKTKFGTAKGRPINEDKFTALAVFQWTARKNPDALLLGWALSSLGKRDDCCLLVKAYGATFAQDADLVRALSLVRKNFNIPNLKKNVYPVPFLVPDDKMPELYRAADIFVCTSRGEGFGLPVAEALACGLPAVYTGATAHAEFAVGYPVDCRKAPVTGMPHIPWYSAEQDWYDIDVYDLVRALEEAYEDWKSGKLKETSAEARTQAEKLHSYEQVGSLIKERVAELGDGAA